MNGSNNDFRSRTFTTTNINIVVDDPLSIQDSYITNKTSSFIYTLYEPKAKKFVEVGDVAYPSGDLSKTIGNGIKIVAVVKNNTDPNLFEKVKSAFRSANDRNTVSISTGAIAEDDTIREDDIIYPGNIPPGLIPGFDPADHPLYKPLTVSDCCCYGNRIPAQEPFPGGIPYRPAPAPSDMEMDPCDIPFGWYNASYYCDCALSVEVTKVCPGEPVLGSTAGRPLYERYIPIFSEEERRWSDPFYESPRAPDFWYNQGIPDGRVIVGTEGYYPIYREYTFTDASGCTWVISQSLHCNLVVSIVFTPDCNRSGGGLLFGVPIVDSNNLTELIPIARSNTSTTTTTPSAPSI